jgi:hypothetical protein
MSYESIHSQDSFSIHINGDNSIDAMLLSQIIGDMAKLTKDAAYYEDPTADCNVNITALKNGSFQIDFSALLGTASTLLSDITAVSTLATTVITTLKGYFELKKILNGSQPKEVQELSGNKIYVTAEDGSSVVVNKGSGSVFTDCNIHTVVQNVSYNILKTGATDGFSFDTNDNAEQFTHDDLVKMTKSVPIATQTTRKVSTIKTDLLIKKPDILGHSTWSFRYNAKNIDAKVLDDEFLDSVRNGDYSIRGGCYITADLEISVDLDSDGLSDEQTTKYTVTKVYGGIQDTSAQIQSLI